MTTTTPAPNIKSKFIVFKISVLFQRPWVINPLSPFSKIVSNKLSPSRLKAICGILELLMDSLPFLRPTALKIVMAVALLLLPAAASLAAASGYQFVQPGMPPVQTSPLAGALEAVSGVVFFPANWLDHALSLSSPLAAVIVVAYSYLLASVVIAFWQKLSSKPNEPSHS